MVLVRQAPRTRFDVSFMVTKQCDLECPFCMYNSSPRVKDRLEAQISQRFIDSLELDCINSFGFYGGEPNVAMDAFGEVAQMLPSSTKIPRFVITNGAWSRTDRDTQTFLDWCQKYSFQVFVSSTPYHQKFQDRRRLVALEDQNSWITLKESERKIDFIPMGKLAHLPVKCTKLCSSHQRPTRIAVQPDGTVIFQNCDGKYPNVGLASEGFPALRQKIEKLYLNGFSAVCPYFVPQEALK